MTQWMSIAIFITIISVTISHVLKRDELEPIVVTSKPINFGSIFEETEQDSTVTPYSAALENFKPSKELFLIPPKEYEKFTHLRLYNEGMDPFSSASKLYPLNVDPPKNIYKQLLFLDTVPETTDYESNISSSKESSEEMSGFKEELVYGRRKKPVKHKPVDLTSFHLNMEKVKKPKQRGHHYLQTYKNEESERNLNRQKYRQGEYLENFYDFSHQNLKPKFKKEESLYEHSHEMENSPTHLSAQYIESMLEENYWQQHHNNLQKHPNNKYKHGNKYYKDQKTRLKKETIRDSTYNSDGKRNGRQKFKDGHNRNFCNMKV